MIMDVNVKLKYKTHIVYEVMRGDFSAADVDSQVLAKKRTTLAVALAPDMRTLQQEASAFERTTYTHRVHGAPRGRPQL